MRPVRPRLSILVGLAIVLAGCSATSAGSTFAPAPPAETPTSAPSSSATARHFPTAVFAGLSDPPVPDAMAAKLQAALEASAGRDGLTATVITPQGTWSGATGMASAEEKMVPDDEMSIASITKTIVAAQVMQLVDEGRLSLDDLASDRLPPDLKFKTNGETIANLLSHRSGFLSDTVLDPADVERVASDPTHAWTIDELLATVGPERGPISTTWEYRGITYVLLGLIVEHVTGQPLAKVLRAGVLNGDAYKRVIYQPDEHPTDPIAMPSAASADTFEKNGGFLPSLAVSTVARSEGAIASDSLSLARWFRALCAGQVVSPAAVDAMTDFDKLPEYALGLWDRRSEYGSTSGALGHTGQASEGYRTAALCFQEPAAVVVALANAAEHDIDTTAGNLWRAATS